MRMMRSPSCVRSGMACLAACDSPEHGSDGHAEPRQISFAENIAGHDLAGCENVVVSVNRGSFVHADAEISKRDSGTQRIGAERRSIEPLRPIRFVRIQSPRAAAIEYRVVERSG